MKEFIIFFRTFKLPNTNNQEIVHTLFCKLFQSNCQRNIYIYIYHSMSIRFHFEAAENSKSCSFYQWILNALPSYVMLHFQWELPRLCHKKHVRKTLHSYLYRLLLYFLIFCNYTIESIT